ncbi:hypothetical protein D5086_030437 [Populus alba]|uniref:Uncharacterized protein n=1 Tax=Populus alba TaxID=43335 RepID=A0ACC4APA1_POPAL
MPRHAHQTSNTLIWGACPVFLYRTLPNGDDANDRLSWRTDLRYTLKNIPNLISNSMLRPEEFLGFLLVVAIQGVSRSFRFGS